MPRDLRLRLVDDDTITNEATGTAVDTEGGFFALVRLFLGTMAAAADTMRVVVQASVDGGGNYYSIGEFPLLDGADDNKEIARPVYVPQPNSGQTVTKVRLNYFDLSENATESFQIKSAWLEPLLSLAPPALDEKMSVGVALLV